MFTKAFLSFVTLAASVQASCIHGTSLMRRQEGQVTVSDFSYTGETGPLGWADIKPDNVACRTATVQSPIAVTEELAPFATEVPVVAFTNVAEAEFENIGTTLEVIATGTTTFAGANFTLQQFHFHTPSEHRINEEYFPVEAHFVHEAADGSGQIAVISVMFQLSEDGTTTDLLTNIIQNIDQIQTPGTATTTGPLDFAEITAAVTAGPIHQYTGSLTTPPCAEGLIFLIVANPLPINVATFNTLKSTIKFNSRYTQNSPGRTNLLQFSTELAIREDGLQVAPAAGGAAAVGNGTQVNEVDVQAIVDGILAGNQNVQFETVTTTVTTVVANGAAVGAGAGAADQENNEQDGANVGNGAVVPPKAAVQPPSAGAGAGVQHGPAAPQVPKPKDAEDFRLSKIARSRIGRRFSGKRRL